MISPEPAPRSPAPVRLAAEVGNARFAAIARALRQPADGRRLSRKVMLSGKEIGSVPELKNRLNSENSDFLEWLQKDCADNRKDLDTVLQSVIDSADTLPVGAKLATQYQLLLNQLTEVIKGTRQLNAPGNAGAAPAPGTVTRSWLADNLPRHPLAVGGEQVHARVVGDDVELTQLAAPGRAVRVAVRESASEHAPGGLKLDRGEATSPAPAAAGSTAKVRTATLHLCVPDSPPDAGLLVGVLTAACQHVAAFGVRRPLYAVDAAGAEVASGTGQGPGPGQPPATLQQLMKARLRSQREGPRVPDEILEAETAVADAQRLVQTLEAPELRKKLEAAIKERLAELEERRATPGTPPPAAGAAPRWKLGDRLQIGPGVPATLISGTAAELEKIWTQLRALIEPQVLALVPPCGVRLCAPGDGIAAGRVAEYDPATMCIFIQPQGGQFLLPFVAHEFTHHLEYSLPNSIWTSTVAFLQHRSGGRALRAPTGNTGHKDPEYALSVEENPIPGAYGAQVDSYAGVYYDDGSTELLTRAMEYAYRSGWEQLALDPAFFMILLRTLRPTMAQAIAADCGITLPIPPAMQAPK